MLTYAKLGLIVLQIAQFFLRKAHDDQQYAAGEEHQIFEQTKAALSITTEGKRLLEKINALSDSELDDLTDAIGGKR